MNELGLNTQNLDAMSTRIGIQLVITTLFAFNFRYRTQWKRIYDVFSDVAVASEPTESGIFSKVWIVFQGLFRFVFRYTFLITVAIVFVASLEEVNLLNAVYLVILLIFLSQPQWREDYWVVLVAYCLLDIAVNYIWGFESFHAITDERTERLLGLDSDALDHLWLKLRWQVVIFVLSVAQLLAYRNSVMFRTTKSQTARGQLEEHIPLLPSTDDPLDAAAADGRVSLLVFSEVLTRYYWPVACGLILFLASFLGHVTVIRLGFALFLMLHVLFFATRLTGKAEKLLWFLIFVYASAVFVLQYIYQFEEVKKFISRNFQDSWIHDSGLMIQNGQLKLFIYLVFARDQHPPTHSYSCRQCVSWSPLFCTFVGLSVHPLPSAMLFIVYSGWC